MVRSIVKRAGVGIVIGLRGPVRLEIGYRSDEGLACGCVCVWLCCVVGRRVGVCCVDVESCVSVGWGWSGEWCGS